MRAQKIEVNQDYVDQVNKWVEEWISRPDSMLVTQFLSDYGIAWPYLKQLMGMSPTLKNTFEVAVSTLHTRLLSYAMENKDMSKHMRDIVFRYIKMYDSHCFDLEIDSKKEIAQSQNVLLVNYESENYADAPVEGVFEDKYRDNTNKRRSRITSK